MYQYMLFLNQHFRETHSKHCNFVDHTKPLHMHQYLKVCSGSANQIVAFALVYQTIITDQMLLNNMTPG